MLHTLRAPHAHAYSLTALFASGRRFCDMEQKHAIVLGKEGTFLRFLVWHLMYLFLFAEPRKEEVEEQDESLDGIVYEDDSAEDEDEHHGKDSPTAVAGWALSAVVRAFGNDASSAQCCARLTRN